MKNIIKKLTISILTLALTISCLSPAGVVHAEDTTSQLATSGQCGDSAVWNYDTSTGTLSITGTGNTWDYGDPNEYQGEIDEGNYSHVQPWEKYSEEIKRVVINKGITSIGQFNFRSLINATSVSLPSTLKVLNDWAFFDTRSLKKLTLPKNLTTIGKGVFNGTLVSNLTIPDSVKTIGSDAFSATPIKKLSIGKNVSRIGDYAFSSITINKYTTKITIKSKKIKSIGTGVFYSRINDKKETSKINIYLPRSKYNSYTKLLTKELNKAKKLAQKSWGYSSTHWVTKSCEWKNRIKFKKI